MIEIKDYSYRYKHSNQKVFENFNLNFESGHIYGLLGRNGVGKSTLLYSIMGLLIPKHGDIRFEGFSTRKRYVEVLTQCFMIPEEFELPTYSLKKYVEINSPFYPNFSYDDLVKNLEVFGLEEDIKLGALSMGQKKKVLMCFALACNTKLLLMDEPTNGLDIPSKLQFRKLIASKMSDEKTIIISTHQVADIENVLDYIIIIEKNRVLLGESVTNICHKLKFGENDVNAIYSQPWLGGNYTVSENTSHEESTLKLELLFNATITEPDKINAVINS